MKQAKADFPGQTFAAPWTHASFIMMFWWHPRPIFLPTGPIFIASSEALVTILAQSPQVICGKSRCAPSAARRPRRTVHRRAKPSLPLPSRALRGPHTPPCSGLIPLAVTFPPMSPRARYPTPAPPRVTHPAAPRAGLSHRNRPPAPATPRHRLSGCLLVPPAARLRRSPNFLWEDSPHSSVLSRMTPLCSHGPLNDPHCWLITVNCHRRLIYLCP